MQSVFSKCDKSYHSVKMSLLFLQQLMHPKLFSSGSHDNMIECFRENSPTNVFFTKFLSSFDKCGTVGIDQNSFFAHETIDLW